MKSLTREIGEQDPNRGKTVRDMNIQKDDPQLIELQDLQTSLLEEVRLRCYGGVAPKALNIVYSM